MLFASIRHVDFVSVSIRNPKSYPNVEPYKSRLGHIHRVKGWCIPIPPTSHTTAQPSVVSTLSKKLLFSLFDPDPNPNKLGGNHIMRTCGLWRKNLFIKVISIFTKKYSKSSLENICIRKHVYLENTCI